MDGTRQPLLLLPGLLNDAELWRDPMAALADVAEARVADLGRGASLAELAAQALVGLPPRFAVAGFSLGGYVAQEILRQAPERVARLALIDTAARPDPPQRRRQRLAQALAVERAPEHFVGFGERLMQQYVGPARRHDRALLQRIQAMTRRLGPAVFVRQSRLERGDGRPLLAAYRGPALVLCGLQDRITPPPLAHEMAALMPQAELVLLEDCGHLAPLEQPAQVAAALRRWLRA